MGLYLYLQIHFVSISVFELRNSRIIGWENHKNRFIPLDSWVVIEFLCSDTDKWIFTGMCWKSSKENLYVFHQHWFFFFLCFCVRVCIVCFWHREDSLESCLRFSFILQFYPEVPTCEILIREGQKEDFGETFLSDFFRIQNCFFNNACLSVCL